MILLYILSFLFKMCTAVRTSVQIMILTLYLCRAVVMLQIFLYKRVGMCYWLVAVVVILRQYLPPPFLFLVSPPFLYFYVHYLFLFFLSVTKIFFFSCHHYRYNIYCFFFTPLLCLLFYPYFLLTHSTAPVVPPHSIPKYDLSSSGFVV